MCELLAMSARRPATVTFSLEEFSRHGGLSGPHKDGWGIAFYQDRDARTIRETLPAASSACERFLESEPIRSSLVLSHIRRATQGAVSLENTQPFTRELGGRRHVFAHNGNLDQAGLSRFPLGRFRMLGETDSERAFCVLLARLEELWLGRGEPRHPTREARREIIEHFAFDLRRLGMANFLYTDGEMLFAHGHRRNQDDGTVRPPGLHVLCRRCTDDSGANIDSRGFHLASGRPKEQSIVLIASVPLTDESWQALDEGEILSVVAGELLPDTDTDTEPLAKATPESSRT